MNIFHHIERGAAQHPGRPAILFEGSTTTYGELAGQAARLSAALSTLGAKSGDRVALFLPNHPATVVAFLAVVRIGGIAVPLNPRLTAPELREVLIDSGAEILVTTAELRATVYSREQALPQIRHVLIAEGDAGSDLSWADMVAVEPDAASAKMPGDAPAVIVYTSGTTGSPKGVTLSHGNVDFVMQRKVEYMGVTPGDRLLLFLPLSHCFGLNAVLNAAFAGGASVVLHRRFEAEEVLRSISRDKVTMFFGVPTIFVLLLEKAKPEQLHGVRYFFSGGALLPRDVEDHWRDRFGHLIYQGYGLTECSPFATYNHKSQHRMGSIGEAVRGVEIAIRDVQSGRHLPAGERGEILLRGPNIMLGYWHKPEETADSIRNGWLHTGDIGRLDEEGYLRIEDRLKDMVIVGGANVYPAEVEQVLRLHPAVLEVAAYGKPDAVLGERVCASVVLRESFGVSFQELTDFAAARLVEYKLPTRIEFLPELPKGPTGKVLKRVLRERNSVVASPERMRLEHKDAVPIAANARELADRVTNWLAGTLEADRRFIASNVPFSELGLTSLMSVELAGRLCGWVGRALPPTIAWQFPTVDSLVSHCMNGHRVTAARIVSTELLPVPSRFDDMQEADAAALLREELARMNWSGETV